MFWCRLSEGGFIRLSYCLFGECWGGRNINYDVDSIMLVVENHAYFSWNVVVVVVVVVSYPLCDIYHRTSCPFGLEAGDFVTRQSMTIFAICRPWWVDIAIVKELVWREKRIGPWLSYLFALILSYHTIDFPITVRTGWNSSQVQPTRLHPHANTRIDEETTCWHIASRRRSVTFGFDSRTGWEDFGVGSSRDKK